MGYLHPVWQYGFFSFLYIRIQRRSRPVSYPIYYTTSYPRDYISSQMLTSCEWSLAPLPEGNPTSIQMSFPSSVNFVERTTLLEIAIAVASIADLKFVHCNWHSIPHSYENVFALCGLLIAFYGKIIQNVSFEDFILSVYLRVFVFSLWVIGIYI